MGWDAVGKLLGFGLQYIIDSCYNTSLVTCTPTIQYMDMVESV